MGFFSKLAGAAPAVKNYNQLMTWTLVNGQWVAPEDSQDIYIKEGYQSLPNVYSIISLITQKSSIVPFEIFRIKNKAKYQKYKAQLRSANSTKDYARLIKTKNEAFEKVEGSLLEQLLLNPNDHQSYEEINEQIDGYKLLTGNSYLWMAGPDVGVNAKIPVKLYVPPAPMVTIVTGTYDKPIKEFKLNFLNKTVPSEEMIHFKMWNPLVSGASVSESIYGMSPLKSCRRLLGKYKDADIAQGSMFKNMGPSGVLANEGDPMNEGQAVAIRDRFKQLYSGSGNAGDIIVTSGKVSWQQIGLSPVDLNILEGKEEMLGELCNAFHVPIGMFTKVNSTENNMVESRKMFITDAVIPLCEHRKGALNRALVKKFGADLVLEYDYSVFSEIQEDIQELADAAAKMYWISPNEKRSYTGYDQDPDPNMDKKYFPSGLMPLDEMNAGSEFIDETML